jgi:hypothetical protein
VAPSISFAVRGELASAGLNRPVTNVCRYLGFPRLDINACISSISPPSQRRLPCLPIVPISHAPILKSYVFLIIRLRSIPLPKSTGKKACPSSAAVLSCLRCASFHEIDFPDIDNQISCGDGGCTKPAATMNKRISNVNAPHKRSTGSDSNAKSVRRNAP